MIDKPSIEEIKAAAQTDFGAMAEEAGFRHCSGRRWHCAFCPDTNPSAWQYPESMHSFCCDCSSDVIDLEQLARGGSVGDAIRRLAERYGLKSARSGAARHPRVTTEAIAEAELFRVGLIWRIERVLEVVKRYLWMEDGNKDAEDTCKRLTEHLAATRAWTPHEAAQIHARAAGSETARAIVAEARQACRMLAAAIAGVRRAAAA